MYFTSASASVSKSNYHVLYLIEGIFVIDAPHVAPLLLASIRTPLKMDTINRTRMTALAALRFALRPITDVKILKEALPNYLKLMETEG